MPEQAIRCLCYVLSLIPVHRLSNMWPYRVSEEELANDPAVQQLTSASEEAQKVARNEGSVCTSSRLLCMHCFWCYREHSISLRCRQHVMYTDASRELTMPGSQCLECLQ